MKKIIILVGIIGLLLINGCINTQLTVNGTPFQNISRLYVKANVTNDKVMGYYFANEINLGYLIATVKYDDNFTSINFTMKKEYCNLKEIDYYYIIECHK